MANAAGTCCRSSSVGYDPMKNHLIVTAAAALRADPGHDRRSADTARWAR